MGRSGGETSLKDKPGRQSSHARKWYTNKAPSTLVLTTRPSIRVHEVHADHIVLDFNHELAGHALTLDFRVVSIE
jgi:FKBP-type peptidyl-prolyl cis-trans isomerase 2